jgi:hypothetical protein
VGARTHHLVPKGTTQSPKWWIPIDETARAPNGGPQLDLFVMMAAMGPQAKPMPRVEVELRGLAYTERMPKHWITNMTAGLSRGLRKARSARHKQDRKGSLTAKRFLPTHDHRSHREFHSDRPRNVMCSRAR